ncbi:hypothetical protein CADE109221_01610 [Castellaniella denitrificans]
MKYPARTGAGRLSVRRPGTDGFLADAGRG